MPTGETSTFDQWQSASGMDTQAGFLATLAPANVNFAGRILQESWSQSEVTDDCFNHVPGSAVLPGIPGGLWGITSSNTYSSDDTIGYSPAAVLYYRQQMNRNPSMGGSCGFTIKQHMSMNSCVSPTVFVPYGGADSGNTNTLSSTINATTVTVRRASAPTVTVTFP
jgi:hypothetical protein